MSVYTFLLLYAVCLSSLIIHCFRIKLTGCDSNTAVSWHHAMICNQTPGQRGSNFLKKWLEFPCNQMEVTRKKQNRVTSKIKQKYIKSLRKIKIWKR